MFIKAVLSLFFLLTLSITTFAQKVDSNSNLYQSKIQSFTKMKKTGSTLGIVGGGLTLLGVALVASADWESSTDDYGYQVTTTDGSGVTGIISLCVGVPMAITGLILNSIGNRKISEYSKKLENINVGYIKKGEMSGLTLAIRF